MSGTTISQLPPAVQVYATDLLPIVEIGTPNITKSATVSLLLASVAPVTYLPISGGTMTGPLILAQDPLQPLEAATKEYVDQLTGFHGDGSLWSVRGLPAAQNWTQAAFGAGVFVIADAAGHSATSVDTVNWTARTLPSGLVDLKFGGNLFVGVGGGISAVSANALTWTTASMSAFPVSFAAVAYGAGKYVAVGAASPPTSNYSVTSTDGLTWTSYAMPAIAAVDIAYGNGVFVALGSGAVSGAGVAVSPDGTTWTPHALPVTGNVYRSIVFANNQFVAAGNNVIATSPDGVAWTAQSGAMANGWPLAYGNSVYVMLASDNASGSGAGSQQAINSPDGINWLSYAFAVPLAGRFFAIAFGNSKFVAPSFGSAWAAVSQ